MPSGRRGGPDGAWMEAEVRSRADRSAWASFGSRQRFGAQVRFGVQVRSMTVRRRAEGERERV